MPKVTCCSLGWCFPTDKERNAVRYWSCGTSGDDDLLVVPITSQPARVTADVVLSDWQRAGLKLPSTVRMEKLATIEKSCVARKLGVLPSNALARVRETLAALFKQILA